MTIYFLNILTISYSLSKNRCLLNQNFIEILLFAFFSSNYDITIQNYTKPFFKLLNPQFNFSDENCLSAGKAAVTLKIELKT